MEGEITNSVAVQADALLESMMLEDGLGGVGEAVETGMTGLDPVRARLALMRLLAVDVAQRLVDDKPFEDDAPDDFFGPAFRPTEPTSPLDETESWEQAVADTHAIFNQVSGLRARCVAEYARRDEAASDELAPVLRLGTYEADRLVEESGWMTTRTPKLLNDVAAGSANLATVAAIASECRDARPDTCERIEDEIRRRGLHRSATKFSARRSAKTLVERYESAAARTTAKKTAAQQTGVWLDSHHTPGLALLSAVMPSADAEAIMTAVDEHATTTHRANGGDGRLLGQHRATALSELALQNVTLTAHLELIGVAGTADRDGQADEAPVMLAPKAGPIAAHDLAQVLTAHAGSQEKSVTINLADDNAVATGADFAAVDAGAYRPPKTLRDQVIRRDGHCRFPGCPRPARFTDLDHVIPWPNGPTDLANLQCLCRRHHQTKQHGWDVTMTPDGTCTWTAPSGRHHTTHPRSRTDSDDLTG